MTELERCLASGVSRTSYYRGVKAGLTVDEIITKYQRQAPNVSELARKCGVSRTSILRKLRKGHTESEILNMEFRKQTPLTGLRKHPLQLFGISVWRYKMLRERGYSIDEIAHRYTTYHGEPLEWYGKRYPHYRALAKAAGVPYGGLLQRVKEDRCAHLYECVANADKFSRKQPPHKRQRRER
ncbi:MAG: hypothetical protein AMXMBFR16_10050 [Candidatus Uhrbacteria bacterium]